MAHKLLSFLTGKRKPVMELPTEQDLVHALNRWRKMCNSGPHPIGRCTESSCEGCDLIRRMMANQVIKPLFQTHTEFLQAQPWFAEGETASLFLLALLAANEVAARKAR